MVVLMREKLRPPKLQRASHDPQTRTLRRGAHPSTSLRLVLSHVGRDPSNSLTEENITMTQLDRDNLARVVECATPKQLAALVGIYWRVRSDYEYIHGPGETLSYQQWLNHARPKFDGKTTSITFCNMGMGIEPDGHTHT